MRTIPRRKDPTPDLPTSADGGDTLPGYEGPSRVSSGEHVRLYIRWLIFDGVLRPGQRVPQDGIANALGVSRVPVREGLIALEREGWMTIVPHRGVFVNALDESSVRDHYELYGLIYGFAARKATERRGAALAEQLAPLGRSLAATEDMGEMYTLTVDLHRAVVDAAGSPRLRSLLNQVTSFVPGNLFDLVPGAGQVERRGALAIVRAITKGDGARAAEEYQTLLRRQGDLVVALFREKGLFEEVVATP